MMKNTQADNTKKLEDKVSFLLKYFGFLSIENMVDTMITHPIIQKSTLYEKSKSDETPTKEELDLSNHSYEQIFSYYSSFDQYALDSIKRVILLKYSRDDEVIRTHKCRKKLWLLMSGATSQIHEKKGMYEKLVSYDNYSDYFSRVIEADVLRTIHQLDSRQEMQKRMCSILFSFARKNPYIGYCQGMNFIVYFMLTMQFSDEEIFWLLVCTLENFTPFNYYTNMMGVATDLRVLHHIIKHTYPNQHRKLVSLGVDVSIFMLEWLVCLFTSILPFYLLVIVWDLFFMDGSVVLIKTSMVLFQYLCGIVERVDDFGEFFVQLEKEKKKMYIEQGTFIKKINQIYLDPKILAQVRQIIQIELTIEKDALKIDHQSPTTVFIDTKCQVQWPICFHQLKKQKMLETDQEIWVFKDENGPQLITDYLTLNGRNSVKLNKEYTENKLVIGRMPHICDVESYEQKKEANNRGLQLDQFGLGMRRVNKKLEGILQWSTGQFFRRATQRNALFWNVSK